MYVFWKEPESKLNFLLSKEMLNKKVIFKCMINMHHLWLLFYISYVMKQGARYILGEIPNNIFLS